MTPPLSEKWQYTTDQLRRWWPAWAVGAVVIAFAIYGIAYTGHWTLWALVGAIAVLALYAPIYLLARGGAVQYVGPLTLHWEPGAVESGYYHPRPEMVAAVHRWWARWEPWARQRGYTRSGLLYDVHVRVTARPPDTGWDRADGEEPHDESTGWVDVDDERPGIQAWGLTYPSARASEVSGSKATDPDVFGWELDLQAAHAVRGDRRERSDHEWLQEEGLR